MSHPTFTDKFLSQMFAPSEALDWIAFRRLGLFERMSRRINANGSRWSYDEPTEPGPIDAGEWCPYDPGGAEAYDR